MQAKLKSAESIYLHIEAMNRNHNYVLNLVIAFTVLSSLIGCGETTKVENLPLAKDYFFSGEEDSRYTYQVVMNLTRSSSQALASSTDTVEYVIGEIDTLRKEGYVVREVKYQEEGLDYITVKKYAFENNDWYEWIEIPNTSTLAKHYLLQNPIRVGASFDNHNLTGYPRVVSTIVSNGTEQIVPAGKYSCLVVRMGYDSTDTNGNRNTYNETNYYSLGNGIIKSEQQSDSFNSQTGVTSKTRRTMQLIRVDKR